MLRWSDLSGSFAPTTPDLRQSEIAISDHLIERIVVSLTPHQERQKSIMAAIQFDSLTGNLCWLRINTSILLLPIILVGNGMHIRWRRPRYDFQWTCARPIWITLFRIASSRFGLLSREFEFALHFSPIPLGPIDGRLLLEEAERVDRVVGSLRSMILFLTLSVFSLLTNLHLLDLYMLVILRFLLFSYAPLD